MRRQSSVGHFFVSEYPRTETPACFFALTIIASYALAFAGRYHVRDFLDSGQFSDE